MTTFFTSDLHLQHDKIRGYCNRPWASVDEMNDALIERYNERVKPADAAYILGDFALVKSPQEVMAFTKRMNGTKFLIQGNHDRFTKQRRDDNYGFVKITPYHEIKVNGTKVVLCHYPLLSFNGMHRGAYHCHGHSHGSLKRDMTVRRYDVGVDCNNFYPISFEEVAVEMAKVTFKPVDHHEEM